LNNYQSQGQRAYVIAFTDLFLKDFFSSSLMILALLVAFLLSIALLRTWQDGLITGLSTGIIIALLSLYILKNYFPQALVAGGLTIVLQTLWEGAISGLATSLGSVAGGAIVGKLISHRLRASIPSIEAERTFYRCPRCGTEFESNPKFCSNCGKKIK